MMEFLVGKTFCVNSVNTIWFNFVLKWCHNHCQQCFNIWLQNKISLKTNICRNISWNFILIGLLIIFSHDCIFILWLDLNKSMSFWIYFPIDATLSKLIYSSSGSIVDANAVEAFQISTSRKARASQSNLWEKEIKTFSPIWLEYQ